MVQVNEMLMIQRSGGLLTIAMNGCDDKGRCLCVCVWCSAGYRGVIHVRLGAVRGMRRCKREDEMEV